MISPQHFPSLDSALCSLFGEGTKVERISRISGGDINQAYGLTLTDGTCIFMKTNTKENLSLFTAEAVGLTAIARTKAIATPRILGVGTDGEGAGYSFLLLEFISGKNRGKNYWEVLRGGWLICTVQQQPGWFRMENMVLTVTIILADAGRSIQGMTDG